MKLVENLVVDTVVCAGETTDNFDVEAVLHSCETDVVFVQLAFEDIAESIVVASVAHTFEIGIVFQTIAAHEETVDGAEEIAENITVAVEFLVVDFGLSTERTETVFVKSAFEGVVVGVVEIIESFVAVEADADALGVEIGFVLVASVLTVVEDMEFVEHNEIAEVDVDAVEIVFEISASVVTVVYDAVETVEKSLVVGVDEIEIVFAKSEVVVVGDEEIVEHFVVVEVDADPFEVGIVLVFVLTESVLTVVDDMQIVENYVVVEVDAGAFEIEIVFVIAVSVVIVVDDVEDYIVDGADADALKFEIVVVNSATEDIVVGGVEIVEGFVFEIGIVFEISVLVTVVGAEETDEHFVVVVDVDVFETDYLFVKSVFAKIVYNFAVVVDFEMGVVHIDDTAR